VNNALQLLCNEDYCMSLAHEFGISFRPPSPDFGIQVFAPREELNVQDSWLDTSSLYIRSGWGHVSSNDGILIHQCRIGFWGYISGLWSWVRNALQLLGSD
jgi:hypothetical protein